MEILIALFFVAAIGFQVLNLIDWVLKKLGFFKTTFEKALRRIGYSEKYYYKNGSKDIEFLQKLDVELQRMRDNVHKVKGYGSEALHDKIGIDFDLEQVRRNIKNLKEVHQHNSLESTRERLKNSYNLIV